VPLGKKVHVEEDENWLITYADMITLLMAFFVILIAVSSPDAGKSQKVTEALQKAGFVEQVSENPFDTLKEEMEIIIEEQNLEQVVSVEQTDKGIMLELSSSSFYISGSAKFKQEAVPVLKEVADILRDFDYDAYNIIVEGHTDDMPIQSDLYPSNWELSTGRAANVVRFFIASGLKPEIMQASGYADTRPKVPNRDDNDQSIPANQEINRRVNIRIERVD
jgi:chemotaxis protein MotB